MINICRPHLSPYFSSDFLSKEKSELEGLSQMVRYSNLLTKESNILLSDTHLNPKLIDFSSFNLVIHSNSGFDNLLPMKTLANHVPVVLGNEIRANAVAHYILNAVLTHFSSIPKLPYWDKKRSFSRKLLSELKIQLVGYGHIGSIVAKCLLPLGPELYIFDPYKNKHDLRISECDVLICAAGLTTSSEKMFHNDIINQFKNNILIINPARGQLFEEQALVTFLRDHPDAFAYLDVFEKEPVDFEQFPKNCLLSSHIAGVFDQLSELTLAFEKRVLKDFLDLNTSDFSLKYQKILLSNDPAYKNERY